MTTGQLSISVPWLLLTYHRTGQYSTRAFISFEVRQKKAKPNPIAERNNQNIKTKSVSSVELH